MCVKHNFIKKSFFNEKKNYYALVKIQVNNSEKNVLEFLEQKLSDLSDFYYDLIIAQNEQQNSDLKVHVDFTEQLGSETYFYCQGEGIKQLIVHHTGQYKINKGEELYLRFKRDSVHLFEENGMSVSKKNN